MTSALTKNQVVSVQLSYGIEDARVVRVNRKTVTVYVPKTNVKRRVSPEHILSAGPVAAPTPKRIEARRIELTFPTVASWYIVDVLVMKDTRKDTIQYTVMGVKDANNRPVTDTKAWQLALSIKETAHLAKSSAMAINNEMAFERRTDLPIH